MNTIDKNDPRLTAYALGELSPQESKEIETAIAANPELQNEIDEIREMSSMLGNAFATEEELKLHDDARNVVKDAIPKTIKKPFPVMFYLSRVALPIAAMFAMIFFIPDTQNYDSSREKNCVEVSLQQIKLKSLEEPPEPPEPPTETETDEVEVVIGRVDAVYDGPPPAPVAEITVNDSALQIDVSDVMANSGLLMESNSSALKLNVSDSFKMRSVSGRKQALKKYGIKAKKESAFMKGYEQVAETTRSSITPEQHKIMKDAETKKSWRFKSDVVDKDSMDCELPVRKSVPVSNNESYDHIVENTFKKTKDEALSTFSIDVDTASYSNMRRFLNQNQLPPMGSVRIEEMINYFTYDYPQPTGDEAFSVSTEVSTAPWNKAHKLVRIGLRGREVIPEKRPMSNLVFLLDVSGSMNNRNKLPLLKKGLKMLVEQLGENDRVSIVVYAGASGLVLPATSCDNKKDILWALERLSAGGSTNGAGGIQLAYQTAVANYIEGGINRVILATDGDFNVGTTNRNELTKLIEKKAKSGVFLSVLGFGMGNYKDSTLETLADKGNGNYAYIDTVAEAEKVLVKEMGSTLITIAKDVKIQVDFNSAAVKAYRLIGYENRMMAKEHFNDDTKDAGEIGAGHTVTALYEIIPVGVQSSLPPSVEPSKYATVEVPNIANSYELLEVRVRYKQPDSNTSSLLKFPLEDSDSTFASMSDDFRFATGVATFGMLLRNSKLAPNMTLDDVLRMAESSKDKPYRSEFIELVKKASRLKAVR